MTTAAATARIAGGSYARGATDVPLISRPSAPSLPTWWPASPDREALVSVHQAAATPTQLQTEATAWPARCWAWAGAGRPRGHLVAQQRRMGADAAGHVAGGPGAGQHQPGLPHGRGGIRAEQGGLQALVTMARFKTSDYLGMLRELAPEWAHGTPGQLESCRSCRTCTRWSGSTNLAGRGEEPGLLRFRI